MGAYLSRPVTEKETYSGSNKFLEYGGASMQVLNSSLYKTEIPMMPCRSDQGRQDCVLS